MSTVSSQVLQPDFAYEYGEDCLRVVCSLFQEQQPKWDDIRQALAPSSTSLNPALNHDVALFLLAEIPSFSPVMESNKGLSTHRVVELDTTLDACGSDAFLVAACRILSDLNGAKERANTSAADDSSNLVLALPLILRTVRRHYLEKTTAPTTSNIWRSSSRPPSTVGVEDETEITAQLLLRLPLLISNACYSQRLQLPSWAIRQTFLARLVQCSVYRRAIYLQALIRRLVQLGSSDTVAQGIWDLLQSLQQEQDSGMMDASSSFASSTTTTSVATCCFTGIPTRRDKLKLMQSMVQHCLKQQQQQQMSLSSSGVNDDWKVQCETQVVPYLSKTVRPCLTPSLARQLTKNLLLCKPTVGTPRFNYMLGYSLVLLLKELHANDTDTSSTDSDDSGSDNTENDDDNVVALKRVTQDMVLTWAERNFVHQSSPLLQRRITNFLRSSLPFVPFSTSSSISQHLIRGVSVRLESSHAGVRADGMRIAELLAQHLGGEGAQVRFSELEDDEDEYYSNGLMDTTTPSERRTAPLSTPTTSSHSNRHQNIDPDAEYQSSDSDLEDDEAEYHDKNKDDDDDSLVWDDELIPLQQEHDDEEDLRETAKPVYLRDCLELLQTPETNPLAASRHETSLVHLEALVRSKPMDLPDVAVPLTEQLLRMEDKFSMDDFDERLRAGLVALAVTEPLAVGDLIIHDFMFEEASLHRRMLGLYALERTAKELCGDTVINKRSLQDRLLGDGAEGVISGNHRQVPGTDTTRRWGRLRHPNKPQTVVNRFSQIAPRWFYGIVGTFMQCKDDAKLWGGANGARLLSHMIVTLSTIVECSGNHTTNSKSTILAGDLIEFAWRFRVADDATIRASVLVAMASSFSVLDDVAVLQLLHGNDTISQFLTLTSQNDPDEINRKVAQVIARGVSHIRNDVLIATKSGGATV